MADEVVAYRFRPPESHHGPREWRIDTAENLPEKDRETLREAGWEVQPLTTMEGVDGAAGE